MRELKSIHKMGIRLLKMIHREDSSVIPLHLLDVCLSLAQIYAGLFLTAGLIDRLATAEEEFDTMPLDKAGRLVASLARTKTYKDRVRQDMQKKAA